MALYRCGTKATKLNAFRYNAPQFATYAGSTAIIEIVPMKLTRLYIQVAEYNANSFGLQWKPNLRIRRKGTNTWDDLDVTTTFGVASNTAKVYQKTITSFNNYEYDAIQYFLFDPIRSQYNGTGYEPYIEVSGTITDGN